MAMELQIYEPSSIVEGYSDPIVFNYEDLKNDINQALEKYRDLVYDDTSIKEAKTDRATLNKFKEAIEARRIAIKKQCMAPYETFEKQIKEIVALIDKPILAIDTQVKSFEQKQWEDKEAEIKAFYAEVVKELVELVPYSKIANPKWKNISYKINSAKDDIVDILSRVRADLKVLGELQTEFTEQLQDFYLRSGYNLSTTLAENRRLVEQKAKMAAFQEEKRLQELAQVDNSPKPTMPKMAPPQIPAETQLPTVEQRQQLDFRVWVNRDEMNALLGFLKSCNIKFGKVGE